MSPAPVVRTVERMRVEVHPDVSSMAAAAADVAEAVLGAAVHRRGVAHAMFATGNSQLLFTELLTAPDRDIPWDRVVVFHMDEYAGMGPEHPASFQRWIQSRIVDVVHPMAAHLLDGLAPPEEEADRYAALLAQHPLDLCCLGIGENGHLAFNDPPVADFADPKDVKVVALDEACRLQQVGEGHFPDLGAVPTHAITVTIPALLRAGRVLAIAPEARKAGPVHDALTGPVTAACPASTLRTHDTVTLYLDPESSSQPGW